MKTKTFDCVEMKHQGAARLQALLEGMTMEEEVAFWREREEKLLMRRQTLSSGDPKDQTDRPEKSPEGRD
jgi:hypothetical protein